MIKTLNNYNQKLSLASSIVFLTCILLLASCGSNQGDDLDQFMNTASNDMHPRIEPIPEVKSYTPIEFNTDGQLNDPFKPRKAKNSSNGGVQPNLARPKEPLEAYPLESLKYFGQNFGIVTEISDTAVTLKEIVQDDLTGDWADRTSSMNLQE